MSDTHGYLDPKIFHYFKDVDEVWHAGDIGDVATLDQLRQFKPLRIVYGNIDGHDIRCETPLVERFKIEEVEVLMTHIAGKPGKYAKPAFEELKKQPPNLFVCGHSHILLVKMDPTFNMLWMNPGACGIKGFHQVRTILRFSITKDRIHDLEVVELGKRI
ncbi:MAG TPA: metallophosphoesterase family protein [Taishania sp.]|nr:metallophosphoesterase family protein [Taishania sp.]